MKPLHIFMLVAAIPLMSDAPVKAQPTITTDPRTQFAWEGKPVALGVTAKGATPLVYQWWFNDKEISDATNRTLTIPKAKVTDYGNYRVMVTAASGAATSQVAHVMVGAWAQPTGPRIPELASLDTNMQTALVNNVVPGGSLAVVKDGRLVFARGYGYANVDRNEPVQPDSLFRLASLSKTIAAATVMKQVEDGKVDLDAPAFGLLNLTQPTYPAAVFDSRLTNITVRQLLNHTGGWNSSTAIDPLGRIGFEHLLWFDQVSKDLALTAPVSPTDIVRWAMGKKLQTKPGSAFSYSNIGFLTVGRVIEKVTGLTFETAAQRFLAQAGITRIRLTDNLRADPASGEVQYYLDAEPIDLTGAEPKPINFDLPYAWPVSVADSTGGMIASAIDYARFVAAIDGQSSYPDILSTNSVATMLARPTSPVTRGDGYFGLGWDSVSPTTGVWYKAGDFFGFTSLAMKWNNGVIFVFLLNSNPTGAWAVLKSAIPAITDSISQWPTHDLFPTTLSYDAWRAKHFSTAELADPKVSADLADPDGDGVVNLLEYAHGTDPRTSSEPPRVAASLRTTEGKLSIAISFRRLLLEHELDYALEGSSDLKTWSEVKSDAEESVLNADGTLTATRRIVLPEDGSARFLRLRVSRKSVP